MESKLHTVAVDVLTADVQALQGLLSDGNVTSHELIDVYLNQVRKHNDFLHAVIETTPRELLLRRARELDDERRSGTVRGPLHGIPIFIKVCGFGVMLVSGWSGVGGQVQSAYVRGGIRYDDGKDGHSNPSGSSSGSAVAVSAGFSPVSIGTETDGSLICPAGRASLYTIKPTICLVPQEGIVPASSLFDSVGPMAKSVYDLAVLLDAISKPPSPFVSHLNGSWAELSVATLDPHVWKFPDTFIKPEPEADKQIYPKITAAYDTIKAKAKRFVENVPLKTIDEFDYNGRNAELTILKADMKTQLNDFLQNYLEESNVRSLEEIIEFNKLHADQELPPLHDNQEFFIETQEQHLKSEEYDETLRYLRKLTRDEGIDRILKEYDVDVIIGPADSFITSLATGSGYPVAGMPLTYLDFNGRPLGLAALAGRNQDATLVKMMSAWETTFPKRKPPPRLVE
ncbi:putative glutamyl-tRNA amidotransferase subunit A [Xylaria sp. FL1777]|nr:putative glutamyl-tRNA amidotransferase subunit A [Xylaria sp. FL1777]